MERYSVEARYTTRTYGGCLEGAAPKALIIKRMIDDITKMWGKRAMLVREPEGDGEQLPPWVHAVWLNGSGMSPDADGSELVVVWFDNNKPDSSGIVDKDEWVKHAADFWY
jgi:hypothetical protein